MGCIKIVILFWFIEKPNPIRFRLRRKDARVGPGGKAKGGIQIIICFGFIEKFQESRLKRSQIQSGSGLKRGPIESRSGVR